MKGTSGQSIIELRKRKMDNKEKLEILKRKLIELETKVRELNSERNTLINLLAEVKTNQNIKLNNLLKDLNLEGEISYLKDWVEFYEEKLTGYKNEKEVLEKEVSEQEFKELKEDADLKELIEEKSEIGVKEEEVREQLKELFEGQKGLKKLIKFKETRKNQRFLVSWKSSISTKLGAIKEPITNIFKIPTKLYSNRLVKYGVPLLLLLLIINILFISKPGITGYVTLTQEKTYDDNLNLIINESENYTWKIDNIGDIKDIKASGRVTGNGSVKIYIEKDGERYLIYDNNLNNTG